MKRFLISLPILFVVWVLIPLLLVSLNNYFKLPILGGLTFKMSGLIIFIIGSLIVLYFTILHIKTGRVTPLPVVEPPKRLIIKGLYNYSRNPMYIAIMATFLGEFLMLGHLLLVVYPVISFIVLTLFITYVEEPELRKKFGNEYIEYTKRVSRWL